ncbi:uncharacterized protein LOC112506543 [Cynara cardunculus var. scolymus]|uniref:uncharacterized protein LOC112506543 n=1 Tax=Cynara cardunculus var. scolymus TaxID=59895 RepID=UPI000D62319D|nr:uncharacterized protein LOC112506543 [Cynara cardunculus var. scolymus]
MQTLTQRDKYKAISLIRDDPEKVNTFWDFQEADREVAGLITLADNRKLVEVVPDDIKNMWNEWGPRGLILISLASQIILSQLGLVRKHSPRTRIRMALWCAYLLANFIASAALGVITRSALDVCNASLPNSQDHKPNTNELISFWAPFLLIHLGGPDTITAFALEDNELWLRHFVELLFQSGVALYILLLSWPGCSDLPLLSILVYVVGFIKCFERVQALRLANTENLRDSMLGPADPGPNYPKFLERIHLKKSQGFHVNVEEVPEPPLQANDHQYPRGRGEVSAAYILFQTFKRLFVDLILTFEDRDNSQSYFLHLQPDEAFHAVEIELGFAYDMLYTKATVVYTFSGLVLRFISVFLVLMLPVSFFFMCGRAKYQVIDVVITYLLIGTLIFMEIFAFITMLRSDWTDYWLSQHDHTRTILVFPFLKRPTKQWWSRSIAQLDLLSVALEEKPASFLQTQKFFGVDKVRVKHRYKTYSKVSDKLQDLIYSQFRDSIDGNSDPKTLCTHKGSFSLRKNECDALLWSISKVEFDQSILIWNIATALCYYSEMEDTDEVEIDIHRAESKHISDYLLYLLVSHPVMLPIGIGMIRYRDTCAEAMRFFKEKGPITGKTEASRKLLEVDCSQVSPSKVKGDRCKSALFEGCILASTLKKMERERMWKVVSQVWIEILAYAATHCRGFHHEQQLRKGGEFLTHVWLLMAHLGITEQFQVSQGHARARIIVS